MDVFTLYRGLSSDLQNIIKIYLLSYGTEEVRLLKPIFQRLLEFNETNKMTATLWQYNVAHRPNEIIQGTFEMQIPLKQTQSKAAKQIRCLSKI